MDLVIGGCGTGTLLSAKPLTVELGVLLLDDPGTSTVSLGPAELHGRIAREDVTATLAELLHEPRIGRQILDLNTGSTPIDHAWVLDFGSRAGLSNATVFGATYAPVLAGGDDAIACHVKPPGEQPVIHRHSGRKSRGAVLTWSAWVRSRPCGAPSTST